MSCQKFLSAALTAGAESANDPQRSRVEQMHQLTSIAVKATIFVVCAFALYWCCWTALVWYRYHPHLPWRDTLLVLTSIAPLLQADPDWAALPSLFELHYSAHRIAVSRVLVLLDVGLFNGQNHVLYAGAWLSMLAILALYIKPAITFFGEYRHYSILVAALAVLLMFTPAHVWNLLNPVNTSWHISLALAMAAFYALLRQRGMPRKRDWVLAYMLATLAALSTFAGVVCWLLLPVIALACQPRAFLLSVTVSLVLAVSYAQGMTSDAEVALLWDQGSVEVLEQIRAKAQAAISANTPWRIMEKTCRLLTWPLVENHALPAGVLAVVSLALIAAFWLQAVRLRVTGGGRQHLWIELSLLSATLCLATLVAANMGRVIDQPNYIHGPSFERYQTLNSVYWLSVVGMLASIAMKLNRGAAAALLSGASASVLALMLPTGWYLKQEVASAEYAARLYMTGERAQLREPAVSKLARFTPEYVFSFDEFFSTHEAAYRVLATSPDHRSDVDNCDNRGISFRLSDTDKTGVKSAVARFDSARDLITREITLFADGELIGRLYPTHSGDFSPPTLLLGKYNEWRGLVESGAAHNDQAIVMLTTLFGTRPLCSARR